MNDKLFKKNIFLAAVIINSIIFLLLSMLHIYWAFGGTIWLDEVLPTSSNGLHRLNPSSTSSLIIAFGLLMFAMITVGNFGVFGRYIKRRLFHYGILIIALIFFLRAIGDFKFIGFFKRVKETNFAINDTHIFSPVCLCIASVSLIIFVFSKKVKSKH